MFPSKVVAFLSLYHNLVVCILLLIVNLCRCFCLWIWLYICGMCLIRMYLLLFWRNLILILLLVLNFSSYWFFWLYIFFNCLYSFFYGFVFVFNIKEMRVICTLYSKWIKNEKCAICIKSNQNLFMRILF